MARDDLASYSSAWDIDQQIANNEISISVGAGVAFTPTTASAVVDIANVPFPVFDLTYQAQGQSVWHQAYLDSTAWDLNDIGGNPFWPGLRTTNGISVGYRVEEQKVTITVYNQGPAQTVRIRYYAWSDTLVW